VCPRGGARMRSNIPLPSEQERQSLWDKGNQDKNQNPCSYESLNQPRTISWRVDLARRFAGNKTILLRIGDVGCSKRPGKGNSC